LIYGTMLLRHHARQLRSVQRALTTAGGLPVAMRAVRVFEPGPAETALNLSDAVEVPEVKPGEVLVRNEFSGVNFHDTYTRSGLCAHPSADTPTLRPAIALQGS